MTVEVLAGIGIFLGCFGRAFFPYLQKKRNAAKDGDPFKWDSRFLWTAIFSFFIAGISTMLALSSFQIPTGSLLAIFGAAFVYGWGVEDITNKVVK